MNKDFTLELAKKLSKDIVKAVGAVEDFLRVRLLFPLANPLQNFVEKKVACRVKYENVPNFCFPCSKPSDGRPIKE
jgi:hypothetical protein